MERVIFLVERTGERITCLLNPESVVTRRKAGIRTRREATGIVTGPGLSDDPVLATGGGVTEIDLDLLFDVAIARELSAPFAVPAQRMQAGPGQPEVPVVADVRDLTRPLWNLAETVNPVGGRGTLPAVRFIWGRTWNVLGVVTAAAERLERFAADGSPGRSWFRMRFRRISDTGDQSPSPVPPASIDPDGFERLILPVAPGGSPGMRLDLIAGVRTGDPSRYRAFAEQSGIDDPLNIAEGTVLRIPPLGRMT